MNRKNLLILIPATVLAAGLAEGRKALPRKEKPLPGKRRIACIGDSITFGAGVARKREKLAWPYVLGRKLGEEYQVLNYGINGATALLESKVVFPKWHDFIDAAVEAKPELFLLMLGTNDAKDVNWRAEDFVRDYSVLIDRIQTGSPQAKLVLLTPPTAFPGPGRRDGKVGFGINGQILAEETVPRIQAIAEERGLPLIDLHSFTAHHPEWFGDGIHPNAEGNQAIADFLAEEIHPFLPESRSTRMTSL